MSFRFNLVVTKRKRMEKGERKMEKREESGRLEMSFRLNLVLTERKRMEKEEKKMEKREESRRWEMSGRPGAEM